MLEYRSYQEAKEKFRWNQRWSLFDGSREKFNIAHECIDRHPPDRTAIRIKFSDGRTETCTFGQMSDWTRRFANLLEREGVNAGDRVVIFLHPSFELYVSLFGAFRRGAIVVMASPLFGPEALNLRIEKSNARAIILRKDTEGLVDPLLIEKLNLKIIYADELFARLESYAATYSWATTAETPCMIQFSSGTTGSPKAVTYNHGAITVAAVVMKFGNGIVPTDEYFCPSSPAWGHGIWYGTISPLIFGKAIGTYSGKFDPERALEAMEEWNVTNMAAISSHYRLILRSPNVSKYRIRLQKMVYTGEPMSQELIQRAQEIWGITPYVQYGTTECGPISLDYAAFPDWIPKPGSLGKPMIGGQKVAVIDDEGRELPPKAVGQVALWKNGKWLKVGDMAYFDEDGYLWYVSRADDVIISAGYTIGPIEVEEALCKHVAVRECAVVGSPDMERGEIVKAFLVLKEGFQPSKELEEEIKLFVRERLSKHEYPREIEFVPELPKTPDGKVKRKALKEIEKRRKLGLY
ncbi:MAG: AMP-binding protein [Candidatus Bathyarchaeia archaeon]